MNNVSRITMFFTKKYPINFLSYKDYLRHIVYALRRANVRLVFSQGYHPRPHVYSVASLSLGVISLVEPISVEIMSDIQEVEHVKVFLPTGIDYLGYIGGYISSYIGVYRSSGRYFIINHPSEGLGKFIKNHNIPPYEIIKEDIILDGIGSVRNYLGVS